MEHTLSYLALPTLQSISHLSLTSVSSMPSLSFPAMSPSIAMFAAVALFSLLFLVGQRLWGEKLPPGTKRLPGPSNTLPWLGRVHDIDPQKPWVKMKEFSDEFDGFYATTITGETHIWIGRQDVAFDLFAKRAQTYASRPPVPAVPGSHSQAQYLPLMAYDDSWKRQRRFDTACLATAHNTRYFEYITIEARRMLGRLLENPSDYYDITDNFCARISTRLAYGNPAAGTAMSRNAGEFIPQISPAGPITTLMPLFGKLPEWLNPSKRDVRMRRENEARLYHNLLEGVRKEMALGTDMPTSYAKTYFEKKAQDPTKIFDDHEAAYAVGMLSTVAIFTITGPLYSFLLAMVLHQDWQDMVREEVDRVLGDRLCELSDSPNLPLLRAAIQETVRWRPPVPLGVPRLVMKDDIYNGYFIPKGAIVHACDLAIARDPAQYPEPERFNPGRWLEPEYPTYKEPLTEYPKLMGHHQFGCGLRICPGIALTECELLIALSAIIQNFTLKKKDDGFMEVPVDPDRMSPFLIGGAKPFEMDLKIRDERRATLVTQQWLSNKTNDEDYQLPHFREKIKNTYQWYQLGDSTGATRY